MLRVSGGEHGAYKTLCRAIVDAALEDNDEEFLNSEWGSAVRYLGELDPDGYIECEGECKPEPTHDIVRRMILDGISDWEILYTLKCSKKVVAGVHRALRKEGME